VSSNLTASAKIALATINTSMRALLDCHPFCYTVSVPWPVVDSEQPDWDLGVHLIESWLDACVGRRLTTWAWTDSADTYQLGVGFRWQQDRTLFVLRWG